MVQDNRLENLNWSQQRRTCMTQAARLMGADDEAASNFAMRGATLIEGFSLHLIAMAQGDGAWAASMRLARPDNVSEAAWSEALLVANGQTMMMEDWAFGLEGDGDAVLLMLLPEELSDERLLAARLSGMVTMCKSVVEGAEAIRSMSSSVGAEA